MSNTITQHIEQTANVCGGKPRIAGTRIRVQDIVIMTEQGQSPDEIITGYPHLTLADVYAALTYYHDNRQEIDRQIREDDDFVAEMQARYHRTHTPKAVDTATHADSVSS